MTQFCQTKSMGFKCLIVVILSSFMVIGCADIEDPLTPEDVDRMIAEALDEADIEQTAINAVYSLPEQIARRAVQSTVYLSINTSTGTSSGSGFFIARDKVATNYHVVKNAINGKLSPAFDHDWYTIVETVAIDEAHDLAIVRVDDVSIPRLILGDSDPVWDGTIVYVIGNPLNQKGTFSSGIVSAVRPMKSNSNDNAFQITAPISPGSSGGPVLDRSGKVIGIIYSQITKGQNLNFAIPVNYLKTLLATIR